MNPKRLTVFQKIHHLIAAKSDLADSILDSASGAEKLLTDMSDDELIRFVSLDIRSLEEG